ncbi:MAG: HEAT repeat domain-containing protein [Planctomycetota bacterium]|nr:HEAT repeat domain-containing protein [Planctomycetota bacterium]
MTLRTTFYLLTLLLLVLPTLGAAALHADVLTTTEGLVLEGTVEKLPNGWYRVTTKAGPVELAPDAVASVQEGVSPRAKLLAEAAETDAKDAVAFYRHALRAEAAGLEDLRTTFLKRVLAIHGDHPAARRALGYERHEGAWVSSEAARRGKGLVLYRGRWMLPAEVESVAAAKPSLPAAKEVDPAKALIRTLATGAAPLQAAARLALARTDDAVILQAALDTLFDKDAKVRIASARLLGRLGDESALRGLIFSGARDTSAAVRREAVLAAQAFGHDDTAVPFVRALNSKNLRIAANAAEALALLGDQRVAPYLVKRMHSHGSSTRNTVSFLNQVSYVRDFDVEIAQASNIANPDVATIQEGVVLDVQVKDASWTQTWIEPYFVKAWNQLMGQKHRSADEARAWYIENKDHLPRFPEKPGKRAPRRSKGRMIGAPAH